ncbi:4-hydroxy-tetrahydrodipicolinate synthase [Methylacidimicrobium cyclopophantes]|uniref:4-hydroxy-tetrahydrodipicolinate synthase n=1 Tax=Methylacidimicrobium cyclopophantes TaxID=1041766 RepID=A0A5E6MP55_9BACT|nr:4-hydroxy-tetrahydrodipicolinate synthase [Methylacidimicrobium cyclopophantes]VVM07774.1 4-hydroxy-tetrahydrodipicolinate synthase [Methylacidimicrobium cyclopophantes]
MRLLGTYTALVTPFRGGVVDEEALRRLVEAQIEGGVAGLVPVGTTGESPTLTHEEHIRVIAKTVEFAAGRVTVLAGTGSNSTAEAIELTRAAEEAGADGALLVAPYYNKPSQAGLYAHFSAIAQSTRLPLVLYSIPGRCGVEIAVETVLALAQEHKSVIGLKEAGGSVDRLSQLRQLLPDEFALLSGDDSLTLPFLSVGAVGVISVASNLLPKAVVDLVQTFLAGDIREAERLHRRLYPLFRDLFVETNPVPIKTALSLRGWITPEVRLPLVPLQPNNQARLEKTLSLVGME